MTTVTYVLRLCLLFSILPQCEFDGEKEVLCDFMLSCILPCSFRPGLRVVVNWERLGLGLISGYWDNQERHTILEEFKGRTSMFVTEISKGNASMRLNEVRVQDGGQYTCITSASSRDKTTYVRVRVKTSVEDVRLELGEKELLCRAENIFPKPNVTWTFRPGPENKQWTVTPTVTPSQSGLFSVTSSVSLPLSSPHEIICNISTEHSWGSATYRRNPEIPLSDSLVVPCTKHTSTVKSLVWKFNNAVIYEYSRTVQKQFFSEFWTQFGNGLTESSGLKLKNLNQDQLGLFRCELSTLEERFIIVTEVTQTKEPSLNWKIIIPFSIFVVFLLPIGAFCLRKSLKVKRQRSNVPEEDREDSAVPESVPMSEPAHERADFQGLGNPENIDPGYHSSTTLDRMGDF